MAAPQHSWLRSRATHPRAGHDKQVLLCLIQEQVTADSCIGLDGNISILLHLSIGAKENLKEANQKPLEFLLRIILL